MLGGGKEIFPESFVPGSSTVVWTFFQVEIQLYCVPHTAAFVLAGAAMRHISILAVNTVLGLLLDRCLPSASWILA